MRTLGVKVKFLHFGILLFFVFSLMRRGRGWEIVGLNSFPHFSIPLSLPSSLSNYYNPWDYSSSSSNNSPIPGGHRSDQDVLTSSSSSPPQSPSQSQSFLQRMGINIQSRHFSLPPMSKVSETLGAINVLGRYFLKKTREREKGGGGDGSMMMGQHPQMGKPPSLTSPQESQSLSSFWPNHYKGHGQGHNHHPSLPNYEPITAYSDVVLDKVATSPLLTIRPEEDEKLGEALYTLGRNVLGQNVTDSLVPVVQTVNNIGKFLPPLVYRDGRIILGNPANSTNDGGSIKDVVCTTPSGGAGLCLDLSGCPSLLFDLTNLRKSLCFKALFIPGVCCPNSNNNAAAGESSSGGTSPTRRPLIIVNTPPPTIPSTSRPPSIITGGTLSTRRPIFGYPHEGTLPSPPSSSSSSEVMDTDEPRCGLAESPSFRIVGGSKSQPGMWPWMAAIFLHGPKGTEFWCGGSVISKRYILTAAHCTKDQKQKSFAPRQFTVRLGDYDLMETNDPASPETFRVMEIIAHPDFSGMGFYNDVALLKLDRDISYNRFISPVCLPSGRAKQNNFVGSFPTVIGWGTNKYGGREHSALQEVKLPVWSNSDCDRAYFQPITDIFLCAGLPAGGKDACQGDSGGPLMLEMGDGRWTQIGIVSFGNRCAEAGYPGVYTRITKFLDWIENNAI